jgi:hypothetical protein
VDRLPDHHQIVAQHLEQSMSLRLTMDDEKGCRAWRRPW